MGDSADSRYAFAWRADTGFVRESENKETYDRLVAEAGEANFGIGTGAIGTGILLDKLPARPEFSGHTCRTRLITW